MTKVSGFSVVDENGESVPADPHGNNIAFSCLKCGWPVLAVIREHQRGASSNNPSVCRSCKSQFWVESHNAEPRLIVHYIK